MYIPTWVSLVDVAFFFVFFRVQETIFLLITFEGFYVLIRETDAVTTSCFQCQREKILRSFRMQKKGWDFQTGLTYVGKRVWMDNVSSCFGISRFTEKPNNIRLLPIQDQIKRSIQVPFVDLRSKFRNNVDIISGAGQFKVCLGPQN